MFDFDNLDNMLEAAVVSSKPCNWELPKKDEVPASPSRELGSPLTCDTMTPEESSPESCEDSEPLDNGIFNCDHLDGTQELRRSGAEAEPILVPSKPDSWETPVAGEGSSCHTKQFPSPAFEQESWDGSQFAASMQPPNEGLFHFDVLHDFEEQESVEKVCRSDALDGLIIDGWPAESWKGWQPPNDGLFDFEQLEGAQESDRSDAAAELRVPPAKVEHCETLITEEASASGRSTLVGSGSSCGFFDFEDLDDLLEFSTSSVNSEPSARAVKRVSFQMVEMEDKISEASCCKVTSPMTSHIMAPLWDDGMPCLDELDDVEEDLRCSDDDAKLQLVQQEREQRDLESTIDALDQCMKALEGARSKLEAQKLLAQVFSLVGDRLTEVQHQALQNVANSSSWPADEMAEVPPEIASDDMKRHTWFDFDDMEDMDAGESCGCGRKSSWDFHFDDLDEAGEEKPLAESEQNCLTGQVMKSRAGLFWAGLSGDINTPVDKKRLSKTGESYSDLNIFGF